MMQDDKCRSSGRLRQKIVDIVNVDKESSALEKPGDGRMSFDPSQITRSC